MEKEINKGVRCNVCDCVYNEKSCDCNKMVIEVSKGQDAEKLMENPHFCKSYICKNEENNNN